MDVGGTRLHRVYAVGLMPVTPEAVERRMMALSREVDDAHADLVEAERAYHAAKVAYELGMAKERLRLQGVTGLRVQDVADRALVACEELFDGVQMAEAIAKAARANANRLRTQVDLVRSVGTSVRASLEL